MSFRTWNDYFIPGTSTLKNKLGVSDSDRLARLENDITFIRLTEILSFSPPQSFGLGTFLDLHRHIFQDVYDWAGQIRKVPETGAMTKAYRDVVRHSPSDESAPLVTYSYFPVSHMGTALSYTFGRLEESHWLQDLSQENFIPRLAEIWGEVNSIHPFREGNTRTQIAFFSLLSDAAGHYLDTSKLHWDSPLREEFIAARFHNLATADSTRLATVIGKMILPSRPDESSLESIIRHAGKSLDGDVDDGKASNRN